MKRYLHIITSFILLAMPLLSVAQKTRINLGTQVQSSVFIDSTTATVISNTTSPFLAAGSYTYSVAITDGAGRWSNLASFTISADGSHNYAVTWNPPSSWWSLGPGTQFSNLFTTNANVFSWVSVNSGPLQHVLTPGSSGFVGYNWWNPYVRLSGGYTTDGLAVPSTLNTLPALNLTAAGPVSQMIGMVLQAPQMGMINIAPSSLGLAGWLALNGPQQLGTLFIDPENATGFCAGGASGGGGIYTEVNGVGQGSLYFCNGVTRIGSGPGISDGILELARTHVIPRVAAILTTCNSGNEGSQQAVTNSTSNTWGAIVVGGGSNHVLAYCNGTNWTVAGR